MASASGAKRPPRRPLDAMEDEAAAILGTRGKLSGHGGKPSGKQREGRDWARYRAAKVVCWLNRPRKTRNEEERETEKKRGRSHLAGRISARRRRRPRSLAHLPERDEPRGPAHLCRSARTRAALGISAAHAAPPPLRLHAVPPLLVHSPVRPRLRAPPLLVLRGLVRPLQDRNGQVIPSLFSAGLLLSGLPFLCSAFQLLYGLPNLLCLCLLCFMPLVLYW